MRMTRARAGVEDVGWVEGGRCVKRGERPRTALGEWDGMKEARVGRKSGASITHTPNSLLVNPVRIRKERQ